MWLQPSFSYDQCKYPEISTQFNFPLPHTNYGSQFHLVSFIKTHPLSVRASLSRQGPYCSVSNLLPSLLPARRVRDDQESGRTGRPERGGTDCYGGACRKMKTLLAVSVLLLASMASAEERVQDGGGSRRGRGGHFGDFGDSDEAHDDQFDHEAVLGSAREAEEFDRLPAAEAKERLLVLAGRMDQVQPAWNTAVARHPSWLTRFSLARNSRTATATFRRPS